jgi:hypothetical protein
MRLPGCSASVSEELFAATLQLRLEYAMRFPPPVRYYAPLLVKQSWTVIEQSRASTTPER